MVSINYLEQSLIIHLSIHINKAGTENAINK